MGKESAAEAEAQLGPESREAVAEAEEVARSP
jgi:hypothetical protein